MVKFTAYRQNIISIIEKYYLDMRDGRPYTVTIKPWFKPRTTGKHSQNHHANGHIQQICMDTGNSFTAVKEYIKERALDMGYPFETLPNDIVKPKSEADLNTQQCAMLIETTHLVAAEWNIRLIEDES